MLRGIHEPPLAEQGALFHLLSRPTLAFRRPSTQESFGVFDLPSKIMERQRTSPRRTAEGLKIGKSDGGCFMEVTGALSTHSGTKHHPDL